MNIRERLRGWRREDRGWPRYLPGGRIRTSTAGLLVAFIALFWLYQVYEPPVRAPEAPASAVVPPGFVPDPDYTWVPRTQVQEPRSTPTTTTTPTTTEPTTTTTEPTTTSPTTPTSPGDTTSPTGPPGPTTTVIDPDGPGPLSPQTFTQAPPVIGENPTPTVPVPPTTLPPQ
ncbi:hypothetical protein [Mycolicibacterium pyrenivorans]|uniref:hypothetical protein n=1 Tax=Mycolicibacterium pyrenivorans TaxID=187102 RepID=UPI0021F302CC|nr:hypothetical protein [Mycolicibacterium pyrenivorans]MCV7150309.1 hypothetical protein [Mycolicibacterium pyrenivorans]